MFEVIEYSDPERTKWNLWFWSVAITWSLGALIFERVFHHKAVEVIFLPLVFLWGTRPIWKRTKKHKSGYLYAILWIMLATMIAVGGWLHWWLSWICLIGSMAILAQLEKVLKRRAGKRAGLGDLQS